MSIYLDWNATTPRHSSVRLAMDEAERGAWANPSSLHKEGRTARNIQENAREKLAQVLSRSPRDIIFTSGGTEANHLALSGAKLLITSKIEHPSIALQAEWLAERGTQVHFCEVDSLGRVVPESIEEVLKRSLGGLPPEVVDRSSGGFNNQNTPLVAVMAANHETGVIQPLQEVRAITQRYGARLHVDAIQWLGRLPLDSLLVADSVAITAHKFRGPKGVGALAFDCGWSPLPLGRGGAQERGLRAGTVDATALAGLDAALSRLDQSLIAYTRVRALARELRCELLNCANTELHFHGADVPNLGHVLNLRFGGWRGDELVAALDLEGVCVSSGSACSAGTAEPSAVITAMLGRDAAVGAVRISLGEESIRSDIDGLLVALRGLGILKSA